LRFTFLPRASSMSLYIPTALVARARSAHPRQAAHDALAAGNAGRFAIKYRSNTSTPPQVRVGGFEPQSPSRGRYYTRVRLSWAATGASFLGRGCSRRRTRPLFATAPGFVPPRRVH
jgi:hypothetical protein